jgi:hypothetical protein
VFKIKDLAETPSPFFCLYGNSTEKQGFKFSTFPRLDSPLCTSASVTLPLKNVFHAEWFNSTKESGDEKTLNAR